MLSAMGNSECNRTSVPFILKPSRKPAEEWPGPSSGCERGDGRVLSSAGFQFSSCPSCHTASAFSLLESVDGDGRNPSCPCDSCRHFQGSESQRNGREETPEIKSSRMWKPQPDSLIFKAVLREQVGFPWSSHLNPGYPQRMPPAAEGFLPWVGVPFLGQCWTQGPCSLPLPTLDSRSPTRLLFLFRCSEYSSDHFSYSVRPV